MATNKMEIEEEKTKEKFINTMTEPDRNTNIDLCFMFDTTGSMFNYIDKVKKNVSDTISQLIKGLPNIQVSICAVSDYSNDKDFYVTKWLELSRNEDDIVNFIKNVDQTPGGFEFAESYELALKEAINLKWRNNSKRSVIFIGDSIPHEYSYTTKLIFWREELQKLIDLNVKIYGVSCGTQDLFFKEISDLTGGLFLKLTDYKYINDMFMAICYREGGYNSKHGENEHFQSYEHQIRKREGNHITAELDMALTKLRGSDTTKLAVTGRTSTEKWFFKQDYKKINPVYALVNGSWIKQQVKKKKWNDFHVGDMIDVLDTYRTWYVGTVIDIAANQKKVLVHYDGWPAKWDEWIKFDSYRLKEFRTKTSGKVYTGSNSRNNDVFYQANQSGVYSSTHTSVALDYRPPGTIWSDSRNSSSSSSRNSSSSSSRNSSTKKSPTKIQKTRKKAVKRKRTSDSDSDTPPAKAKKEQMNMKLKSSRQAQILAQQMLHRDHTQKSVADAFDQSSIKSYKRQLRMVFKIYDCDNNGHINKAELASVLRSMNKRASKDKIDLIFKEIDTDANGTIEKEEFVDYFVYRLKEKRFKDMDEKKMRKEGDEGHGRVTEKPIRKSSTIFAFYTENAGESYKSGLELDEFGNTIGAEYDLGKDDAYKGKIFVLTPKGFKSRKLKACLKSKGFEVVCSIKSSIFISDYKKYDQFWMIPSTSDKGDKKLAETLQVFHKSGGSIAIFAHGDQYEQVNPSLDTLLGIKLKGNYSGKKILEKGIATKKSHFQKHLLTTGISNLAEGQALCKPVGVSKKAYCLATSSTGHACILVASVPYKGRILVSCSSQLSDAVIDKSAGVERFVKNTACWLTDVEHTLNK